MPGKLLEESLEALRSLKTLGRLDAEHQTYAMTLLSSYIEQCQEGRDRYDIDIVGPVYSIDNNREIITAPLEGPIR